MCGATRSSLCESCSPVQWNRKKNANEDEQPSRHRGPFVLRTASGCQPRPARRTVTISRGTPSLGVPASCRARWGAACGRAVGQWSSAAAGRLTLGARWHSDPCSHPGRLLLLRALGKLGIDSERHRRAPLPIHVRRIFAASLSSDDDVITPWDGEVIAPVFQRIPLLLVPRDEVRSTGLDRVRSQRTGRATNVCQARHNRAPVRTGYRQGAVRPGSVVVQIDTVRRRVLQADPDEDRLADGVTAVL